MPVAAPTPHLAGHGILRRVAWLAPVGLASYGLRFASSWLVLDWAGDKRFDPHGFGLLGDGVLLLALAPVMAVLLGWLLLRRRHWRGLLACGATTAGTVLSVAVLLLLGAPLPGQVWALVLLPLPESWPVLASVLLWFAVVAAGRAFAVAGATPAAPRARS